MLMHIDECGAYIKILLGYFQIISVICTFRLGLPEKIVDGLDILGNPVKFI